MFWHSAANSNAIDSLLDQSGVQLITILDQDEVLMEIRAMNKKLIEFLTRPECMHEMLDLITTVPSADIPIPLQYKYPNTACEVLTSDISFAEKIAAEPMMMNKLFYFFRDSEPPLNPLLASYVCRVLGEMVARKLDQNWYSYQLNLIQVMGYLQSEPSLLQWFLKHLETSSVCDFLQKLVMNVEGQDMRSSLYEWLENKEHFFMSLINSMDRMHNKEAHMNISRLVGDLLFALQDESSSSSQDRSMDSEPFLLALKSHATFERLLDVIFGEDTLSQSSIVYGLEMLLALLGIAKRPTKQTSLRRIKTYYNCNQSENWNVAVTAYVDKHNMWDSLIDSTFMNPYTDKVLEEKLVKPIRELIQPGDHVAEEKSHEMLPSLTKVDVAYGTNEDVILPSFLRETMIKKMDTLLRFLQNPPSPRQAIRLSNGVLKEPLGMERLAIVKFIAHIITLHDAELNDALIQSGVLRKALDLFWEHPWNNFLHHYVCQIVIQITKIIRSNNCAKFLIIDYAFPEKIMEAFEMENTKAGYFGHLAKITDALMDALERNETVKSIIPELDEGKPEVKEKFKEFYEVKWKTYHANSTQLLAGAALPTSGVSMTSNAHNYESDPGVTWDSSSGAGNADNDNDNNDFYEEASSNSNFGATDRYDAEKSKSIFEMFCFERSNTADDDEEERNDDGGGIPNSMPYDAEQQEGANEDYEWNNPQIFFKQLEEQEKLFGQLALNGSIGGDGPPTTSGDGPTSAANFIENPWAGQESVQVSTADPWAAFEFGNLANSSSAQADDDWANFDQSFPATTGGNGGEGDGNNVPDFGEFMDASDVFGTETQPQPPTPITPSLEDSPPVTPPKEGGLNQNQL